MDNPNTNKAVMISFGQLESLLQLTSLKDVRAILRAIIDCSTDGKEDVEMPEHLKFGWNMMKQQIQESTAFYQEAIEFFEDYKKQRKNCGSKGGRPKKTCDSLENMEEEKKGTFFFEAKNSENLKKVPFSENKEKQEEKSSKKEEIKETKENIYTSVYTKEKFFSDFLPDSAADVQKLAQSPFVGMLCTLSQAEDYYIDRVARNWIPYGQTKPISSHKQLCADLLKWLRREDNRKREEHSKYEHNPRFVELDSTKLTGSDGSDF